MAFLTDEQINDRKIVQVAFIVDDLEKAAMHWVETHGAGPFFVLDRVPVSDVRDGNGAPAVLEQGIAVGQWGPLMVELVRMDRVEPQPVADIMTAPGFSHIAYFTADPDAEAERLEKSGAPVLLSLEFGSARVRFHDGRKTSGFIIEQYPYIDAVEDVYRKVAEAAEGWDGSNPVRPLM
jgi:hypothetical protein